MPLRVLCLHGFRTNKRIMQDQTRDLRTLLGPDAEFVLLDAPLEAAGDSDAMIERAYAEPKPFFEWWRQITPDGIEIIDAEVAARVIQEANVKGESAATWVYEGMEAAIEFVTGVIDAQGPFDILVGFSQGAVMATLLGLWYAKTQQPQPWKLTMCFNGLRAHGSNCVPLLQDANEQVVRLDCPSVHVFGLQDPLIEDAKKLAGHYQDCAGDGKRIKLLLEHDSGHRFPSAKRHPEVYQAILSAIESHCFYSPRHNSARL